jgi:hypothetical protein
VESRVVGIGFDEVRIGMELELTLVPLDPDAANPIMIHAFQPKGASA